MVCHLHFELEMPYTTSTRYRQYSWLRELLAEPRWVVELAASTVTPASLTVPEWIIRVEKGGIVIRIFFGCITEIAVSHPRWNSDIP